MHKGKGSFKSRAIQEYRNNLKKIKQRKVSSIWDIIDDPELHFFQKVDYIRHHFVYYDGNYELFHDKNGRPTYTKKLLDQVIAGIINKKIDPSELNALNKEILKDHKARLEQKALRKEAELDDYIQEIKPVIVTSMPQNTTQTQDIQKENLETKEIIEKYLATLPEKERSDVINHWTKGDIKKVAKCWAKKNNIQIGSKKKKNPKLPNKKECFAALLKGYQKYAKKEWKNSSEEQ